VELGFVVLTVLVGAMAYAMHRAITAPQPAAAPAPAPPAETLSARLHALAAAITSFAESAAHPRELEDHAEFRQAVSLLASPDIELGVVLQYATGANWTLSCVGQEALAVRPDRDAGLAKVLAELGRLYPWPVYFSLKYLCTVSERPPVGVAVLHAAEWWLKHDLIDGFLDEHFTRRAALGDAPDFGNLLDTESQWNPATVAGVLHKCRHPTARALLAALDAWQRRRLDRGFLQTCGRLWTGEGDEILIELDALREPLADAEACINLTRPRSLLVVGEARMGKTSLIKLLAKRLATHGWQVFEAGGSDLMAGQQYYGQLEERLRRLVRELAADKRVIWYVPDFRQIAIGGTHSGQPATILDQVLPAVTSGRLVIVGEATPAELTTILQNRPSLRSTFEVIRLRTLTEAENASAARALVGKLRELSDLEVDDDVVPAALQLARQYLATTHMPGAVIDLLRLSAHRAIAAEEPRLTRAGLYATLSQLTGLPRSILDDAEAIALDSIHRFFTARVIGQDEAVGAIVDRIAMLKAGLTDPARPIGVFLFAGPTGTGKTELAKSLAEFLFGSVERMIRLDMSEFQTAESTHKILGERGDPAATQSLTLRVRKQPFCVILLDEFEKAHSNIWDLFLQVFDAGRLTDAAGQTVDFRHSIIVLTSNLGATQHRSSGLGFAPAADAFSQEQVERAVHQSFRPEFVNRLDKVIVFRPLTRELMRGILQKELKLVLERRGLRDREWAVEWEASALEFLLDKGFSPEMGARPLKRAIDQYLLAPLAATIVEHRFPAGDQFLFVRSGGQSIEVEFVDPDADGTSTPVWEPVPSQRPVTLAALILQPAGDVREREALDQAYGRMQIGQESDEWESLRESLAQEMRAKDFWSRADRHQVLARYALMDRVRSATVTAQSLRGRLTKTTRAGRYSRELVSRLALQLHLIDHGIRDALSGAPVEAILSVQPAMESGGDARAARAWAEQVRGMYRQWAARRRMQLAEVGSTRDGATPLLLVLGFGVWSTLIDEVGLHVLEGSNERDGRTVVRVKIAPRPLGVDDARGETWATLAPLIDRVASSNTVVRRYRLDGAPLVRDARYGWRTGRVDTVLQGDFDLLAEILRLPD
jgi:ATP-dependent Clp protease ATP-binding subunit ClpC